MDNDIILVRIASHRNFASVCFTVVAGKGAPSEMSQNLLHFCIYFSTGQFVQRLLADSDVPSSGEAHLEHDFAKILRL